MFVVPGIRRLNSKIREQFWYIFELLPYFLVNPTVKISLLRVDLNPWKFTRS